MVGFISNLAPLLNYLRRRSPGPPFPPDFRQAGERGLKRTLGSWMEEGGEKEEEKGRVIKGLWRGAG